MTKISNLQSEVKLLEVSKKEKEKKTSRREDGFNLKIRNIDHQIKVYEVKMKFKLEEIRIICMEQKVMNV